MKSNSILYFCCYHGSAVQDICNKNYMQFCDSMDKVITMRRDVKDLSVDRQDFWLILQQEVSEFHDEVSFTGLKLEFLGFLINRALKEAQRYISLQQTKEHVDKAFEDVVVFDNLVTLVERVNDLVFLLTCVYFRWKRRIITWP